LTLLLLLLFTAAGGVLQLLLQLLKHHCRVWQHSIKAECDRRLGSPAGLTAADTLAICIVTSECCRTYASGLRGCSSSCC
jgi:hypothetical protein